MSNCVNVGIVRDRWSGSILHQRYKRSRSRAIKSLYCEDLRYVIIYRNQDLSSDIKQRIRFARVNIQLQGIPRMFVLFRHLSAKRCYDNVFAFCKKLRRFKSKVNIYSSTKIKRFSLIINRNRRKNRAFVRNSFRRKKTREPSQ